jgi:MscS family membrane protein
MDWLDETCWGNPVRGYLVAAGLILGGVLLGWLLSVLLRRWVIRGHEKTEGRFDDVIAGVGHRLVGLLVFLAGLYAAFRSLLLPEWIDHLGWAAFVVLWTALGALFVSRLANGLIIHYLKRQVERSSNLIDEQLVPIVRSLVGVLVWIIAGLFALANLGFNVGSILAGLGIGGLALAMASKDMLSNLFGAFTILVQGPFRVGDAVVYQGQSGTVERLGLRATEVRTYTGNLVTVPNALATTSVIENVSRRPSFRVLFNLRFEIQTPRERCEQAAAGIRQAIESVAGVAPGPLVHFVEFGDSALLYQVLYYITDQARLLDIRHEVNTGIHQALERAQVRLAFPTYTIRQA